MCIRDSHKFAAFIHIFLLYVDNFQNRIVKIRIAGKEDERPDIQQAEIKFCGIQYQQYKEDNNTAQYLSADTDCFLCRFAVDITH